MHPWSWFTLILNFSLSPVTAPPPPTPVWVWKLSSADNLFTSFSAYTLLSRCDTCFCKHEQKRAYDHFILPPRHAFVINIFFKRSCTSSQMVLLCVLCGVGVCQMVESSSLTLLCCPLYLLQLWQIPNSSCVLPQVITSAWAKVMQFTKVQCRQKRTLPFQIKASVFWFCV